MGNEPVTDSSSEGSSVVVLGNSLLCSPSVHLVHVDEALFFEGWAEFQKYHDKSFSLTDCISFVVMRRMNTHRALAFDQHFEQAGFTTEP
jgi:predicted nucleic acid-binding protein